MQDISVWLQNQIQSMRVDAAAGEEKADFEPQARRIWENAIAAGYTNEQIKAACGGDIETYLLERRKASGIRADENPRHGNDL